MSEREDNPETPEAPEAPETIVRRTAALARLSLGDDEVRALGDDFGRILGAFQSLAEVDVDGEHDSASDDPAPGTRRADEPAPFPDPRALLDAAPDPDDGFFGVPKTLGGPA